MAIDQATRSSWVQTTAGVQGGEPCIRNTRITVHGLVEWRSLGRSDAQIISSIPGLTHEDLVEAWAYYEKHRKEIDDIIRQHRED